jgi:hypothetical protein
MDLAIEREKIRSHAKASTPRGSIISFKNAGPWMVNLSCSHTTLEGLALSLVGAQVYLFPRSAICWVMPALKPHRSISILNLI